MTEHFTTSLDGVLTACEENVKNDGEEANKAEGDVIEDMYATIERIDGACNDLEKMCDECKKTTVANINNVIK